MLSVAAATAFKHVNASDVAPAAGTGQDDAIWEAKDDAEPTMMAIGTARKQHDMGRPMHACLQAC